MEEHPESYTKDASGLTGRQPRSRLRIILPGAALMGLAAVALVIFLAGRIRPPGIPDLFRKYNPDPVITHEAVIEQITRAAKLVSVEYFMSDVITYEDRGMWPFSDKKILIIAKARIMAGFNLNKGVRVSVTRTRENEIPEVTIQLPRPVIISIEPEYRYYDIRGKVPPDVHNRILADAEATLRLQAVRAGILDRARESVKHQLPFFFPSCQTKIIFSPPVSGGAEGTPEPNP